MSRIILVGGILLGVAMMITTGIAAEPTDADELQALLKDAESLPKETKAGRMVADRTMAQSMIEYGLRNNSPEVILLAVEILHKTPVTIKKGEGEDETAELEKLIEQAVEMRPDDEMLIVMAERVVDSLEEATRGLAGGPQAWTVKIKKRGYYQLDPRLIYNAQEKAIVTATTDPGVMLGASVRRGDQRKELTRSVGRGKVQVEWNSGITTTGWDVRIWNLTGKDGQVVKVVTN
jgi:hypothetical protein